jgi:PAS domain S-box-containing protein
MSETNPPKIRILVVDDDRDILTNTARILEKAGYIVDQASSGEDALNLMQHNPADLLLLNRDLPGIDGMEVCRQIKQNSAWTNVFVILISASYTESEEKSEGLEAGADSYITRPIANRELLARVSNYVRLLLSNHNLRASELRYRRLFEGAKDGILILDARTGMIVDVNPFLIELLGFSHKTFLGKKVWELGFFKDIVANEAKFAELQAQEFVRYENLPLETTEGRQIAVEFVSNVYLAGGHKVIQCNIRDITERKRTEETFNKFFEQPMSLNMITKVDGVIHRVNKGMEDLLGYDRKHLVGGNFLDLVHPDDQAATIAEMGKVVQGTNTIYFENRYRKKSGEFRILAWSGSVSTADQLIFAAATDITERKRAEQRIQQLNRTNAFLSDINKLIVREKEPAALLAASCRIAVETGNFRMAWVGLFDAATQHLNPVASAGFVEGYTEQVNIDLRDPPHLGGPTATCLRSGEHCICNDIEHDPDYLPWRDEAMRRGYRSSGGFPLKVDGKTIGVFNLYTDTPQFFNPEELRLLNELAADISFALELSQREAERLRMEESHTRLALAVEQTVESIVITDTNGTILYTNPSFEKATGYTRAEAIGQNPRMLKSGKQDAAFYRQMWDTLKRGDVWAGHLFNKRKDGTIYEEDATISPVRDAGGTVVNYVAVKYDVTREIELATQLQASQKMESIGQLAAGVAHDFNNILAVISMQAGLLGETRNLLPDQTELIAEISEAVRHASDLTSQLLIFSQRHAMQMRDLDMNDTVTNLSKMLQRILGEDIRMEFKLAPHPLFVHADAGMLDQILMNLTVNSRQAMPKGGRLIIETSEVEFDECAAVQSREFHPGSFACLSVSDTGCGIAPENLERIFEPFFTTKDVGKGTGLGLATVFGIVKQHKGWINVYSEIGNGTAFRVYLPRLIGGDNKVSARPAQAAVVGGNETILVVEDNTKLRGLLKVVLSRLGYRILEAPTGVAALELWKQNRNEISLLLTDMVMPAGVDGKELAKQLLEESPGLKVIYASGYSAEVAGKDLVLKDGVNFLSKPFDIDKLVHTVRARLDS